jgi:4,5-dihydroxyphthalate decarboxylase
MDMHPSAEAAQTGDLLPLTIAFGDYDRTRPLIDGRVTPRGVAPTWRTEWIGHFCTRPVYEEFDIAEMSLSWYITARNRGEPVWALPIFPLRMPVLGYMYCRSQSTYQSPRDLIGKRVGTMGYRYTVNLWLRGILQDHYGVRPQDWIWVTNERERNNYVVAPEVKLEVQEGRHPEQMLLDGDVEAVVSPEILPGIEQGDPRLRRLFPDPSGEQAAMAKKMGFLPITHTMVIGDALHRRAPWLAESLVAAFRDAQRVSDEAAAEAKYFSAPDAMYALEASRKAYGTNLYTHGLAANRTALQTLARYAFEQDYTDRMMQVNELFAPGTHAL